jgi:hypothetical protein
MSISRSNPANPSATAASLCSRILPITRLIENGVSLIPNALAVEIDPAGSVAVSSEYPPTARLSEITSHLNPARSAAATESAHIGHDSALSSKNTQL